MKNPRRLPVVGVILIQQKMRIRRELVRPLRKCDELTFSQLAGSAGISVLVRAGLRLAMGMQLAMEDK